MVSAADWFDDDWEDRVDNLSEGELIWYKGTPREGTSLTSLSIRFLETSAREGWVEVGQCHSQLASAPAAQLIFDGRPVRKLRVEKVVNIKKVGIEGESVQLSGLKTGAEICVRSEQQVLHRLDKHHWALISGPFQRRFLDGYYPMQLELNVEWPEGQWRYMKIKPTDGPVVRTTDGQLHLQAHFSGLLKTALVFQRALQ